MRTKAAVFKWTIIRFKSVTGPRNIWIYLSVLIILDTRPLCFAIVQTFSWKDLSRRRIQRRFPRFVFSSLQMRWNFFEPWQIRVWDHWLGFERRSNFNYYLILIERNAFSFPECLCCYLISYCTLARVTDHFRSSDLIDVIEARRVLVQFSKCLSY